MNNYILLFGLFILLSVNSCNSPSAPNGNEKSPANDIPKMPQNPIPAEVESTPDSTSIITEVDQTTEPTTVTSEIEVQATTNEATPIVKKAPIKTSSQSVIAIEKEVPTSKKAIDSLKKTLPAPIVSKPIFKINHTLFDDLLRKHVTNTGKVNYTGFKNDLEKLNTYLNELSQNHPKATWKRNERLAFWINAYNAFTIKLIIDNYPLTSITNLHNGKPWDHQWIKIGSKTYTLNAIENEIIRPTFKDPRIHFAVNCAANSCPKISNRAFFPSTLNTQLDLQTKAFINNPQANTITEKDIRISKIFDWYKVDFDNGNIIQFINRYSTVTISQTAIVNFLDYDWKLNKQ